MGGTRGSAPRANRAADLTRGGGRYACARIGLASRLLAIPDEGRRRGSPRQIRSGPVDFLGFQRPPGFAFRARRPASEASRAGAVAAALAALAIRDRDAAPTMIRHRRPPPQPTPPLRPRSPATAPRPPARTNRLQRAAS